MFTTYSLTTYLHELEAVVLQLGALVDVCEPQQRAHREDADVRAQLLLGPPQQPGHLSASKQVSKLCLGWGRQHRGIVSRVCRRA